MKFFSNFILLFVLLVALNTNENDAKSLNFKKSSSSSAASLHQNKIVQEILKDENFLSASEQQKLSILVDVYNILDAKRQRKFQELNPKNINRIFGNRLEQFGF
jgi:hypothetical protein